MSDVDPKPDDNLPPVMTPTTLAERWMCSERHVRNLINRGMLGHVRLGSLLRILAEHVRAFEKQNSHVPSVPLQQMASVSSETEGNPEVERDARGRKKPARRLDTQRETLMRFRRRMEDEGKG